MATEAQLKAIRKYDDNNTLQIHLKLNKKTDLAIIQQLEKVGNKQGYIKALITADIESGS